MPEERDNQIARGRLLDESIQLLLTINRSMGRKICESPLQIEQQLLVSGLTRVGDICASISFLACEDLVEDCWVLIRPMLELIINLCYLQITGKEEALSYISGSASAYLHQLGQLQRLSVGVLPDIGERRQQATDLRDMVEAEVGRSVNHHNWSTRKLIERAEFLDQWLGTPLFQTLYRSTYTTGHAYIHGNYPTLQRIHEGGDKGGRVKDIARLKFLILALSSQAQCLFAMSTFLDRRYFTGAFSSDLAKAADLMNEGHQLSGLPDFNFNIVL